MIAAVLGIVTILLGIKAFTPEGLPLTRKKHLKGTTGKVIGVACIGLGVLFLVAAVFDVMIMVDRAGR